MRSIASVFTLAGVALALAGCATTFVAAPLPDLDPRLTRGCGPALALAGEDPRVSAKRKEAARRCEAGRREALVGFYAGLQAGRGL